jgi:hypothetical protein
MPVVPPVPSFTSGVLMSSQLSSLAAAVSFLQRPPICRVRSNTTQSLTSGAYSAVNFQLEDIDTDPTGAGGHSTSVNITRFTAVYPCWVWCAGGVFFAGNATGRRALRWIINGALVDACSSLVNAGTASALTITAGTELLPLATGDYLELQALQEAGVALNIGGGTGSEHNNRMNLLFGYAS